MGRRCPNDAYRNGQLNRKARGPGQINKTGVASCDTERPDRAEQQKRRDQRHDVWRCQQIEHNTYPDTCGRQHSGVTAKLARGFGGTMEALQIPGIPPRNCFSLSPSGVNPSGATRSKGNAGPDSVNAAVGVRSYGTQAGTVAPGLGRTAEDKRANIGRQTGISLKTRH